MELKHCLPVWEELTFEQQQRLSDTVARRQIPRGTAIHRGSLDCTGLPEHPGDYLPGGAQMVGNFLMSNGQGCGAL